MKKNMILFNSYFSFYFFQNLTNFDIDSHTNTLFRNPGSAPVIIEKMKNKVYPGPTLFSKMVLKVFAQCATMVCPASKKMQTVKTHIRYRGSVPLSSKPLIMNNLGNSPKLEK